MRRWRRSSPAAVRVRSGGGPAERRAEAAAGEGARRRPCRGGEGAGLGVERVEGSEEMLHPRRIDEGLSVSGESAARRELGPAASMEGSGLGFEAGSEADRARIRREGEGRRKRRHGTQRWPARGATHEVGRRRWRTRAPAAPSRTGEGEGGEPDRWARARKIKRLSLKFKMKVFPGSKIHQSFTGDI